MPARVFLAGLLALQTWSSIPFLDVFTARETAPPPAAQSVQLDVGGHRLAAYLVTPFQQGPLPAVLLVPGREGFTDTFRTFAREMAGAGYVALAIDDRPDPDARGLALLREVVGQSTDLAAAVEWLATRPMVDPERIGAIGWNDGFDAVVRLAAAGKVKAAYPIGLVSQVGMTEQAWVDVYEYLGQHVEEVGHTQTSAQPDARIARIVDIMRAINSDQGVRGRLARALATAPVGSAEWEQARSEAAMLAEAGNLLLAQRPPRGSLAGWQQRATEFRSAAQTLLRAVETRDFAASQQSLRELPQTCAACHADHR